MISLILGPMYSGKSTELLRRLKRSHIAKKNVLLIRPQTDFREYLTHSFVEHDSWLSVEKTNDITKTDCGVHDVIGIDEAQFHIGVSSFCLAETQKRECQIVISGLQASSEGEMFHEITNLIPYCDEIVKLNAVCVLCGGDATMTHYKPGRKESPIFVGGQNEYEARCLKCWRWK